jgi:hypothetical protein
VYISSLYSVPSIFENVLHAFHTLYYIQDATLGKQMRAIPNSEPYQLI